MDKNLRKSCIKKLIKAREESKLLVSDVAAALSRIKGKKVADASISQMENQFIISVDTLLELVDYYHNVHGYTYESFINPKYNQAVKIDGMIESNQRLIEILQNANNAMKQSLG